MAVDFRLALAAENKSTATVKVYSTAVRQFGEWLEDNGLPQTVAEVRAEHINGFIAGLIERPTDVERFGTLL